MKDFFHVSSVIVNFGFQISAYCFKLPKVLLWTFYRVFDGYVTYDRSLRSFTMYIHITFKFEINRLNESFA